MNLMYRMDTPAQTFYLHVMVQEKNGSLSVGVVGKDQFQLGYKISGMLYNGNLTNGSGTLKVGWGPYLKVAVKDIDTDKGEDQHQHHGDTVVVVEYKETSKDITS